MLKPPNPRLHIVYDEDDLAEHAAFVRRLANPECVVVQITPDGRNLDWVAVDIERALGKNPHLSGVGRNTGERWSRIHAWLIGGAIRHLIVARVHLIDARRLEPLLDLALACDTELWLVAQHKPLSAEMTGLIGDWPFEELDIAEFQSRWLAAEAPKRRNQNASCSKPRFPRVPLDEFVLFRSSCRELLSNEEFKAVDRTFQETAASVLKWIDESNGVTEETVLELVRDRIATCPTLDEAVTRIRATQVALFWRRWFLKVDLDRLLATYAIPEQSALDAHCVTALSSYAATRYPAAAAIALATKAPPAEIAQLNLESVSVGEREVSVAPYGELPLQVAGLVRAHLIHRILDGAVGSDPLFVMHTTDPAKRANRATDRAIERLLVSLLHEVGVRITASRSYTGVRGRALNWRWRDGVSVQPLESTREAA